MSYPYAAAMAVEHPHGHTHAAQHQATSTRSVGDRRAACCAIPHGTPQLQLVPLVQLPLSLSLIYHAVSPKCYPDPCPSSSPLCYNITPCSFHRRSPPPPLPLPLPLPRESLIGITHNHTTKMTAVASPQPDRLPHRAEYENPLDFVNAQYRQPSLQHPRQAQSSTQLRQELPPARGQERSRAEPNISRTASKSSVNSKSTRGLNGQRTPSSGESDQNQDAAASARPNTQLVRAITDYGPRRHSSVSKHDATEENWELRHGWEDQYNSTEYLGLLSSVRLPGAAHG